MKEISIVLLNYLNYEDTIECVESIIDMQYPIKGIVIVDNCSSNNSYTVLQKKYKSCDRILVVKAKKNYGFARGNNLGINIARKQFQTDFVFVCNNDVIFKEKDFFEKLLRGYRDGVGVIGPKIQLRDHSMQNKYVAYVTFREALIMYAKFYVQYKDKRVWELVLPKLVPTKRETMLHGCALLFTPEFFKYFSGFYKKTFLYNEEAILYIMCKMKGLEEVYISDTYLYHKEDQSSELSFKNDNKIMAKYQLHSYKYLIWWIIKYRIWCLSIWWK